MPTTLTNGIQLPDKGSVDWYSSMQSNYNLIDTHLGDTDVHVTAEDKANWNSKQGSLSQAQLDAIAQVATNTDDIATLQSGKADASHTHSSSDITDIDDYATKDYVDNSISGLVDNAPDALNTLNELSAALNDDSNFASTVTTALGAKANSADLATVATSGDYNDLDNLPTIPTKTSDLSNDSDFVVSSNLATIATSGDYDDLSNKPSIPTNTSNLNNDSGFVTLNDFDIPSKTSDLTNDSGFITSSDVPTSTSDLINDSNFVDTSNPAVASGITSAKVTDYDTHIADTDIHVTASDKTTWNAVSSKANDSDVVHKSGNETISGEKTFNDLHIVSYGTQYKGARNAYILPEFSAGYSGLAITTLGFSQTLKIGNFVLDANNKPSLDASKGYIQILTGENNGVNACVIEPRNSTSSSLGASSNKWSKIYGTEYYYGSNNVEFSTKFVTTDTNQTVSGGKTFSSPTRIYNASATVQADVPSLVFKNSLVERASTTLDGEQTILFTDKNDNNIASIQAKTYTSGISDIILTSYSEYDGVKTTGIMIRRTPTTSKLQGYSDNITDLGDTNRRWRRVYAMSYYYGNDNVEFSTKFVTTDTNQTVSGQKVFDDINTISSSSEIGVSGGNRSYKVLDKNKKILAKIEGGTFSSGMAYSYWLINNGSDVFNGVSLYQPSANLIQLRPYDSTLSVQLGASNRYFTNCYTSKVNNLEPSSLSLPSDRSARIDISSYITNLGNGANNQYIVPANGYIWLHFTSINSALCYSQTSGGLTNYAQTFSRYSGDGQLYAFFPVRKDDYFIVQIYTSSTAVVQNAYFIPCQGNV